MQKKTLANCSECGTLFVKTDRSVCRKCYIKIYSELKDLSCYIEENPGLSLDKILFDKRLTEKRFNYLLQFGKFWSFKQVEISCRMCKKPFPAVTGRLLCYHCYSDVVVHTSSFKKIKKLREDLHKKDYLKRQEAKKEFPFEVMPRKFGFKNTLKDCFARCVNSVEVEMLPPMFGATPRISNSFGFSRVAI